jgi:glucosamine-6-phosphate deaminase
MDRDYYQIPPEEFHHYSPIQFNFVDTFESLCQVIARELVDLIRNNAAQGKMTKVVLPVGPLTLDPIARLCNQEGVSCESLVIFAMDEYLNSDNSAIPLDHPLSFRSFFQHSLIDKLDPDKKLPPEQLILPLPENIDNILGKIEQFGGFDIVYGGFGINGHFAFNSPPREEMDVDTFKNTSIRVVEPREGDIVQMAIGGTDGNLEVLPPKACTLGMKELLNARQLHLTFMRSWHAGVLRRALFGAVTSAFPGSLVQLHPNVKATITSIAAQVPSFHILQQAGK